VEVGLEVNTEEAKYLIMPRHQNEELTYLINSEIFEGFLFDNGCE